MDDSEFLRAFEACQIPASEYRHQDHLRTAFLYLRRYGLGDGMSRVTSGIRRYAAFQGQSDRYHETLTRFWILLVYHALRQDPGVSDFPGFLESYPLLLDKSLSSRHYRLQTLQGQLARRVWVEPDLVPMP